MVRRAPSRQSLNSSIVTVTANNNSVLDDNEPINYLEFVKRFERPLQPLKPLIGCQEAIGELRARIDDLLAKRQQGFTILAGPTGSGKTTIVRRLAQENYSSKLKFYHLNASWIQRKQFGNPELRIASMFDEAQHNEPAIIFIDELHLICAEKRSQSDAKERIFNLLVDELKNLYSSSAQVLVLAATNRPEQLDNQLRELWFFRDEIRFLLPKHQDRVEILKHFVNLPDEQIDELAAASQCHSFRGLETVRDIALKHCQTNNDGVLNYESFKFALKQFKPAVIQSVTKPCPPLYWNDIGGVQNVKRKLQESVIWPLKHRKEFQRMGIRSRKGALLFGPPGCSKTMLAQALATESGYNFISLKGPELLSKYVGDSEAAVRRLYRNAREIAPCIIFFDEIDGLAPKRNDDSSSSVGDKVVATLLAEFNGLDPLENVFTIAATNRPDRLDGALLRPGRLNPSIYIPLPSEQDRREIFRVHMRPLPTKVDETTGDTIESWIDSLAVCTDGYSGAEIADICQVAGIAALREDTKNEHILWRHFCEALNEVRPRTSVEDLKVFKHFQAQYRSQDKLDEELKQKCNLHSE